LVGAGRRGRASRLSLAAIVALPARFSLLHSDLNDFLFAAIGNEQNGMPLNVVSGLTRLGLDPWEEAAQLAALPRGVAAEELAPIIARLPFDRLQRSDDLAISRRLVELLPEHQGTAPPGGKQAYTKGTKFLQTIIVLGCLALGAAILASIL
jgi:hypothetical protein